MTAFAPIILFIYNRPDHTKQTLEALSSNTLAQESDLFIYADGPKESATPEILEKIRQTRNIAHSKQWCKSVTVIESKKNKGLAASIISGVTEIANKYGKVIVLEDDIVTGKYFLEFMNDALEKYENEKKVWHIAGWRDPVKHAKGESSYFYPTMDCWGWATWADRWQYFKKDVAYYQSVFTDEMKFHFNIEGSEPGNWSQIEDNASGKINTWAIFWYATIFLQNGLCLAPTKSLVKNVGLDSSGVHCGESPKQIIKDSIDYKVVSFPEKIEITQDEYKKNVKFFLMLRRDSLYKKMKNGIKIKLKQNPFFKPFYYFLKDIYYKIK
ncbi:MAG: glycosyltransferase [Treponema sp.]|uniref:glycosyltransferase n=1 Tax=Treponema sp. TaxID=166 RepID=UPI0025E2A2A8|nr:glycosyltransferase [Treponema sp.]MBQ8679072.1 glycosyltransferase [Treponema sp.]